MATTPLWYCHEYPSFVDLNASLQTNPCGIKACIKTIDWLVDDTVFPSGLWQNYFEKVDSEEFISVGGFLCILAAGICEVPVLEWLVSINPTFAKVSIKGLDLSLIALTRRADAVVMWLAGNGLVEINELRYNGLNLMHEVANKHAYSLFMMLANQANGDPMILSSAGYNCCHLALNCGHVDLGLILWDKYPNEVDAFGRSNGYHALQSRSDLLQRKANGLHGIEDFHDFLDYLFQNPRTSLFSVQDIMRMNEFTPYFFLREIESFAPVKSNKGEVTFDLRLRSHLLCSFAVENGRLDFLLWIEGEMQSLLCGIEQFLDNSDLQISFYSLLITVMHYTHSLSFEAYFRHRLSEARAFASYKELHKKLRKKAKDLFYEGALVEEIEPLVNELQSIENDSTLQTGIDLCLYECKYFLRLMLECVASASNYVHLVKWLLSRIEIYDFENLLKESLTIAALNGSLESVEVLLDCMNRQNFDHDSLYSFFSLRARQCFSQPSILKLFILATEKLVVSSAKSLKSDESVLTHLLSDLKYRIPKDGSRCPALESIRWLALRPSMGAQNVVIDSNYVLDCIGYIESDKVPDFTCIVEFLEVAVRSKFRIEIDDPSFLRSFWNKLDGCIDLKSIESALKILKFLSEKCDLNIQQLDVYSVAKIFKRNERITIEGFLASSIPCKIEQLKLEQSARLEFVNKIKSMAAIKPILSSMLTDRTEAVRILSATYAGGTTVIHVAALVDRADVIRWLVRHFPVDIHARDFSGKTAAQLARSAGATNALLALRKLGAEEILAKMIRRFIAQCRKRRNGRAAVLIQKTFRRSRVLRQYGTFLKSSRGSWPQFISIWGLVRDRFDSIKSYVVSDWADLKARYDISAGSRGNEDDDVATEVYGVVVGEDDTQLIDGDEDMSGDCVSVFPAAFPEQAQQQAISSIEWSASVSKWLQQADSKYRFLFQRRVGQLGAGNRSYALSKPLKGCSHPIWETKLDAGQRILWTKLCRSSQGSSAYDSILIWSVSKHKSVSHDAQQIDRACSKLSQAPLVDADDSDVLKIDIDAVLLDPRANTPLKLYTTSCSELANFSVEVDSDWQPVLRLSSKEKEICEQAGTVLLLGR